MITHTFNFEESVEAFERAAEHRPSDVSYKFELIKIIRKLKNFYKIIHSTDYFINYCIVI